MEIKKETYQGMTQDAKLDVLFDYMKATHDTLKGDNGCGLQEEVRVIKASQKRLRRIIAGGTSAVIAALAAKIKFF